MRRNVPACPSKPISDLQGIILVFQVVDLLLKSSFIGNRTESIEIH